MLKVLMYDLGGTLERNRTLLPHARESVQAISRFRISDGSALEYCLVSDFLPADPFTNSKVAEVFRDYLRILDELGLRDLFEPVERRVTLSTHANVPKPDRRLFELALERLGVSAGLQDCLFITENAAHIAAARALGLDCLQFGVDEDDGFSDWRDGLLKIALKFDPVGQENMSIALEILGRDAGIAEIHNIAVSPVKVTANAKAWISLDDETLGDLEGVSISVPATVEVDLSGSTPQLRVLLPDDAKAEATAYVRSLQAHGKVSGMPESLLGPPTHVVETDKSGRRVLKRRGFD